jgi:hypothetical protein
VSAESIGKMPLPNIPTSPDAKPTSPGASGNTLDQNRAKTVQREAAWPGLRAGIQDSKRKYHVNHPLIVGVLSVLPACSAYAQTAAATSPATAAVDPTIELVKALAWPIVALLIAAIFRRPISVFVSAIGSRITKLSLFKVELELVPATAATSTPLLDDIRTATSSVELSDSSRTMQEQLQSVTPADFAIIALGAGQEWLTSRLYIAAVMMERMRGIQAFVFVERAPSTERRLVAVASVRQLRWALARRYPWLEAAWARSSLSVFPPQFPPAAQALPAGACWLPDPRTLVMPQPVITSDTGALEPWQARQIVSSFIESLQQTVPPVPPAKLAEWVLLKGSTSERATYVTRELLASLLPQHAFGVWTDALRDSSRGQRTRAVLRRAADFVALVEGDREFTRLANRRALLEDIAASLGEEPEGNSG